MHNIMRKSIHFSFYINLNVSIIRNTIPKSEIFPSETQSNLMLPEYNDDNV